MPVPSRYDLGQLVLEALRRSPSRAGSKDMGKLAGDAERHPRGAQSGHAGAGRRLEGEDVVEEFVDHYRDR